MRWLRRNNFPVLCGCCGLLVITCWERDHDKSCDNCVGHFWQCGPKGDKPCDGRNLARALREDFAKPLEVAHQLRAAGITGHADECPRHTAKMAVRRQTACKCGYTSRFQEDQPIGN